jgi:hypothetical protein
MVIVIVIVIVIGQDIVCITNTLNETISIITFYPSKLVKFLHYTLQAFHTAGMWEQYRDDAFAERGVEPRPLILTEATVAGERHSFLYGLPLAFILLHFVLFYFTFNAYAGCTHQCAVCHLSLQPTYHVNASSSVFILFLTSSFSSYY